MKSSNKNQAAFSHFVNEAPEKVINLDKPMVDETDKYADDPFTKALEDVLRDMENEEDED